MLVLWAIDAIREPGSLMEQSAALLESWATRMTLQIEPVFVLSPSQVDLTISSSGPSSREVAERLLAETVDRHSSSRPALVKSLLPGQVLMERRGRVRAAAQVLEDYAKSRGAWLVVLPTHGRRGLGRLILGSFAETLILRSKIPTLTIGPQIHELRGLDRLIHSTDFSKGSEALFREMVDFAYKVKAKLWLYHAVPNPREPIVQSGAYLLSGAWIPTRLSFSEEVQQRYRHGSAWVRWARHQGVDCEFVLNESMGNIVEHLLALIEHEKIGLATLASQSGPVSSALLGSITRQVVRGASCPVWIFQPGAAIALLEKPRALAG